ncbi:MAG: sensor histidine kinase [Synergistales bacterium]|nr:sensor histidine kinase [Synergistales bacterium]
MEFSSLGEQLQQIVADVQNSLDYSIESVSEIHEETGKRHEEATRVLKEIDQELADVIEATDETVRAYRTARKRLLDASKGGKEREQQAAYAEAERIMRVRGQFEERERQLRRRRDELQRDLRRIESVLARSRDLIQKVRVAREVVTSKIGDIQESSSGVDSRLLLFAVEFMERDRHRIGRDLHDGPVQQFSSLTLDMDLVETKLQRGDVQSVRGELPRMRATLQNGLADMRRFLWQMNPVGLDEGLFQAIRRYAEQMKRTDGSGPTFSLRLEGQESRLPKAVVSNVFRIIQEAVANAVVHGRADEIVVWVSIGEELLRLKIIDDGVGFEIEKAMNEAGERGSYGLRNMRERAHLAKGTLQVESKYGFGTKLSVELPLLEV